MILVAVLTLVSVILLGAVLFVIHESRAQVVAAYIDGRADQVELEGLVPLIDSENPTLFESEIEQLVAEQLVERFGEIVDATIVEVDGTERPIGEWDSGARLEFYRQLRAGH